MPQVYRIAATVISRIRSVRFDRIPRPRPDEQTQNPLVDRPGPSSSESWGRFRTTRCLRRFDPLAQSATLT